MATYCVSDLHGQFNLFQAIQDFLQEGDRVFCLGDCGDRGPEPLKTILGVKNDPRFVYLKGNHEDMLVNALRDYKLSHTKDYHYMLLKANGGKQTFDEIIYQHKSDIPTWDLIEYLNDLPDLLTYKNANGMFFYLCHSGFTPNKNRYGPNTYNLIWDREHLNDEWMAEDYIYVVHGHTPLIYMGNQVNPNEEKTGALWYCDDHKICIDNASFITGCCTLFNLDTLEEHIFEL